MMQRSVTAATATDITIAAIILSLIAPTVNSLSPEAWQTIQWGGVHVEPLWLDKETTATLRSDATQLHSVGLFDVDGLFGKKEAIQANRSEQGFSTRKDRQTFRGGASFTKQDTTGNSHYDGNLQARKKFEATMTKLRWEAAEYLGRPGLKKDGERFHEITYNWYEPGAELGRHLDEHHEETKGNRGWQMKTRRSVTWLVYLNDDWTEADGGALRAYPRKQPVERYNDWAGVGAFEGDLQVGWILSSSGKDEIAVFLGDAPNYEGQLLYSLNGNTNDSTTDHSKPIHQIRSKPFYVPPQPIDFSKFFSSPKDSRTFHQLSIARDVAQSSNNSNISNKYQHEASSRERAVNITPAAGTLVIFDSVVLPHEVLKVTANRPRVAATGWFHEELIDLLPS